MTTIEAGEVLTSDCRSFVMREASDEYLWRLVERPAGKVDPASLAAARTELIDRNAVGSLDLL